MKIPGYAVTTAAGRHVWTWLPGIVSIRSMPRPRALLTMITLMLAAGVALTGCKDSEQPQTNLPDGPTLTNAAAAAMRDVATAHLTLTTEGEVGSLPLRRAEADITRTGDAKGKLQLSQFGVLLEYEFVVTGKTTYLKGVSGGWQTLPATTAASIYDPAAILDPERGVAKLLATATDPKTDKAEEIDGVATYRVTAGFSDTVAASLVPGIPAGVTGTLWFDQSTKKLRRATFAVPGTAGATSASTSTVTIDLTDLDKPVTVSAP